MKPREERAGELVNELRQLFCSSENVHFLLVLQIVPLPSIPSSCHSSYITTSTAMSEIRELMDATLSQIARGSDDTTSLVFAVQGRVVSVQHIGGQWQPEVFAAGMSSSN